MRNRRALVRLSVQFAVVLIWDQKARDARVTDLGMGGLFAECDEQAPFAANVVVVLERDAAQMQLPAIVRWNSQRGMGLQFGLLGARETHAIVTLLVRARRTVLESGEVSIDDTNPDDGPTVPDDTMPSAVVPKLRE